MSQQFILYIHLILAFVLIGLVLIQHGKGADAGAAFGSGASSTVFGSQGSGSFITRLTTAIACMFALTSISLSLIATKVNQQKSLSEVLEEQSRIVPSIEQPIKSKDLPEIPPSE